MSEEVLTPDISTMHPLYHNKKNQFIPGNPGGGRPKGSRNKLTQLMLDRVAARQESGLSAEEVLIDIMQDPEMPPDLRLKAAAKISDLVYPKAASIEVQMDDKRMSKGEMDAKIQQLLTKAKQLSGVESDDSDTDED